MKPLRILFAGTPDFAAKHLQALFDSEHEVIAVYSQPDRPSGRGKKLTASPVKQLALEHNIAIYQPENFKSERAIKELQALQADVMVVVAYGLILPQVILDAPKYGCLNVHGSILPRWRGAAPIQRAIWAGDKETGVTIMQMDIGLDTGDMLNIATLPITSEDTSATLYEKLAELGPVELVKTLNELPQQQANAQKQNDEQANYAKKLSKEEAMINWSDDAEHIERCIRAFNPWPISYFSHQGHNIKVWQAEVSSELSSAPAGTIVNASKEGIFVATGNGILVLKQLQLPGKKALPVQDILNSRSEWFSTGTTLSNPQDDKA